MLKALLLCVFVSFVTGQSVCGVGTAATRTTCDLTDALTACRTCFPNADPGCTLAIDPVTSITTLTTFRFQDYTAGGAVPAVFSYPVGVVLVFRNDVHFNTALSFCVPSVRTYLPSNTFLISVPGNYVSRMDGGIILRVGSVVPNALNLMTASNTATNFYGVFSYVNPTNQDGVVTPCFSVRATPTYNIGSPNTVTLVLDQFNNGSSGCIPAQGLSGGAIAGIVIGVIVGVALLVVLAIFLIKKVDFDSKRQLFSRTKIHAAESSVPM